MPNKFRKNVWVKRGDFILVEPIDEGDKVKAEICKILTPEHIKEYTKSGIWPERFAKKAVESATSNDALDSDSDESLTPNTNRPVNIQMDNDTESDTDTEDSSSEDWDAFVCALQKFSYVYFLTNCFPLSIVVTKIVSLLHTYI